MKLSKSHPLFFILIFGIYSGSSIAGNSPSLNVRALINNYNQDAETGRFILNSQTPISANQLSFNAIHVTYTNPITRGFLCLAGASCGKESYRKTNVIELNKNIESTQDNGTIVLNLNSKNLSDKNLEKDKFQITYKDEACDTIQYELPNISVICDKVFNETLLNEKLNTNVDFYFIGAQGNLLEASIFGVHENLSNMIAQLKEKLKNIDATKGAIDINIDLNMRLVDNYLNKSEEVTDQFKGKAKLSISQEVPDSFTITLPNKILKNSKNDGFDVIQVNVKDKSLAISIKEGNRWESYGEKGKLILQ